MYEQNGEGKWTNMIRINQINLKAGPALAEREEELLKSKIKRLLKLKDKEEFTYEIVKRSLDARNYPCDFLFLYGRCRRLE